MKKEIIEQLENNTNISKSKQKLSKRQKALILIKRYTFFFMTLLALLVLFLVNKEVGEKATFQTLYSVKEMLYVIPPIFILLGLLDVWVPKEIMVKYMGEESGVKGVVLAILLGSAAAGPLYGAFPVAAVFMKKGVKFSNVLVFIGAWSTTKIPMLLFEITSLGLKFAITRLIIDLFGIVIISLLLSKMISQKEIDALYANVEKI